jgi:hypothetical protein
MPVHLKPYMERFMEDGRRLFIGRVPESLAKDDKPIPRARESKIPAARIFSTSNQIYRFAYSAHITQIAAFQRLSHPMKTVDLLLNQTEMSAVGERKAKLFLQDRVDASVYGITGPGSGQLFRESRLCFLSKHDRVGVCIRDRCNGLVPSKIWGSQASLMTRHIFGTHATLYHAPGYLRNRGAGVNPVACGSNRACRTLCFRLRRIVSISTMGRSRLRRTAALLDYMGQLMGN